MDDKYSSSNSPQNNSTNYAYSGKVMLISVIFLFIFCIIFAACHFYSRLFIMRRSANLRRHHHQRRRRDSFYSSVAASNSSGLSPSALKSLPTFVFSVAAGDEPPLECAVCLSEFLENESGRVLPKCNHAFHVECIDMWLVTHSNCPLCRAPIFQIKSDSSHRVDPVETVVPVFEPGNTSRVSSSSSSPSLPQLLTVTVEVPGLNEGSGVGPPRENGLKTMGGPGPVRSLKRFLSF